MSIQAVVWAMDSTEASGAALLVLLSIARSVEPKNPTKFLAVETLAQRTRLTRRAVQLALRDLEEDGLLHTSLCSGRTGVNAYTLNHPPDLYERGEPTSPPPRSTFAPRESTSPPGANHVRGGGERSSQRGEPSSPRDLIGETLGEGEREYASEAAAVDPHTVKEVGPGGPPLDNRFSQAPTVANFIADNVGITSAWERLSRKSQCATHNGQGVELAQLCEDCGAETWEEAGWMLRCLVKLARREGNKKTKPYNVSEVVGFSQELRTLLTERRIRSLSYKSNQTKESA